MKISNLIGRLLGIVLIFSSSQVLALPVSVDTGSYEGRYNIFGGGTANGSQVFDLPPGGYNMDIGNAGSFTRKTFIVNADGTVSNSLTNDSSDSLIFNGTSTLKFKNSTVNFDPDQYLGVIRLPGLTGNIEIPSSLVLVPGNNYLLSIANGRQFYLDANGQVGPSTFDAKSAGAFIFNGNTLKLRNVTVRIDPRNYLGRYGVPLDTFAIVTGVNDYVLVPGFWFRIKLSPRCGGGHLV